MAKTPSNMVSLGTIAPEFNLPDVTSDKIVSLNSLKGEKGTLIMFICNHCPYVKHVNNTIVELANKFQSEKVNFIAISSNDVENYPDDSPELMKINAFEYNFSFPYLYDESQEIAKKYDAACTPDFSVFNADMKCIYRGQLDGSRPGNDVECNGEDLRKVLDLMLNNLSINFEQKPSIGCNIKWK